jgi:PPM family protein phosphatase
VSAFQPVQFAALTDVGVKRSHNQDACSAQPAGDATGYAAHGHVFVVADGMGGHAVGEKASAKAVRDIPFLFLKHVRDGVHSALRRAFQETNTGIYTVGQENPEFRGLGTTSTALILRPEGAWIGHVGDSRAYRIRDGAAEQLTFDHSWVWEIARRQGIDPDELGDFKKNVIIRSLGPDPEVEVDVEGPHPVRTGDAFLLCSDGLTGVVSPEEIGPVVAALPPDEAARLLVNLANLRGGPDNITVLIVHVGGGTGLFTKSGKRPGFIGRALAAWNRKVPWPFTALMAGCLFAVLSLAMQFNDIPGAPVSFVVAAIAILAGLGGLALHMSKEPEAAPLPDDAPRELHVYKKHNCPVKREIADKFAEVERILVDAMKGQGVAADWDRYAKLVSEAEARMKKGNEAEAVAARCRSLLFLADAFHKARQKEESFRPSWTSPTRG